MRDKCLWNFIVSYNGVNGKVMEYLKKKKNVREQVQFYLVQLNFDFYDIGINRSVLKLVFNKKGI